MRSAPALLAVFARVGVRLLKQDLSGDRPRVPGLRQRAVLAHGTGCTSILPTLYVAEGEGQAGAHPLTGEKF
jgi:hypothetical protein